MWHKDIIQALNDEIENKLNAPRAAFIIREKMGKDHNNCRDTQKFHAVQDYSKDQEELKSQMFSMQYLMGRFINNIMAEKNKEMRRQRKARDGLGKSKNDQLLEELEEIIKGRSFYLP
jgi:hypothetical protein